MLQTRRRAKHRGRKLLNPLSETNGKGLKPCIKQRLRPFAGRGKIRFHPHCITVCVYFSAAGQGTGLSRPGPLWRKTRKHRAGIGKCSTQCPENTHWNVIYKNTSPLRKEKGSCIMYLRLGIESLCVGGPFACAGYGEFAPPHSCRVLSCFSQDKQFMTAICFFLSLTRFGQ